MERATTPPPQRATRSTPYSPPTPEVKRRIEENRLKAKALRERSLAAERLAERPETRTPSGFLATSDISIAGRKRAHESISTEAEPSTNRDASRPVPLDSRTSIQAARKFRRADYIDHDFSKMTDTKGGFLSVEDDPFNKALHAPEKDGKPAHMTLKEWERHQLLKGLRNRKEGPFEPGISRQRGGKKCRECGSLEIDWQWEEVFKCCVCAGCKETMPEKYSLLTKTEVTKDYLLTTPELKDPDLLPWLAKPNPLEKHYHDMHLFLRYQVEEYAFSQGRWGSAEALDAEFEEREEKRKKSKEAKFKSKLKELKKNSRTEAYLRGVKGTGKGVKFGEKIGGGKHEHEWGQTVENEEGESVKTCLDCGMEVEVMEF